MEVDSIHDKRPNLYRAHRGYKPLPQTNWPEAALVRNFTIEIFHRRGRRATQRFFKYSSSAFSANSAVNSLSFYVDQTGRLRPEATLIGNYNKKRTAEPQNIEYRMSKGGFALRGVGATTPASPLPARRLHRLTGRRGGFAQSFK